MRTSINSSCAQVVHELKKTEKVKFSTTEVKAALLKCGRGSKGSIGNYLSGDGYLVSRGFLTRVVGGWEFSHSSMKDGCIVITAIANTGLQEEITDSINEALGRHGAGVVTISSKEEE